MTAPKGTKRVGSVANNLVRKPLCQLMLACDGNTLVNSSKERGYCGACAEALARRAKAPPPLRGENTALSEATRKVDEFKSDPSRWTVVIGNKGKKAE